MKRVLALMMMTLMLLSLCACSPAEQAKTDPAEKVYSVGIVQLMQHVALDQATQGFQDALKEKLGDKVTFDFKWCDNIPLGTDEFHLEFYTYGDTAPDGRFAYRYTEE